MLRLIPEPATGTPISVLCLGAHADDIEIGAGGAVLTFLERHPASRVSWIVFSATPERAQEARASAHSFLRTAGERQIVVHDFQDGYFPAEFARLKDVFEALKSELQPDVILTHAREDHHQDHRTLAELTWNTFRNHLILGYEIPKYDPDIGNPNVFVPLEPVVAEWKVAAIMEHFATQRRRRWFTSETFFALMRLRGLQAAAPSGLAEGFYAPKLWL